MTTVRAFGFVAMAALSMCVVSTAGGCAEGPGRDDAGKPQSVPGSVRAQDDLLKRAESTLAQRCLAERRVTPPPAPPGPDTGDRTGGGPAPDSREAAARRPFPYGIDDPAWAAQHGFGGAAETARRHGEDGARAQEPRSDAQEARRQQRFLDAMFGTGRRELSTRTATGLVVRANSDGCLAEAQRVLYGDQARWFRATVAVDNLEAAAHHRVTRDPAYRAVLARWARCVAPVHKADDPGELRDAWQRRARGLPPDRAAALQRRYAVAEARCVRSTDLAGTGARLERRHTADLRAEYADLIADHRSMRERGLRHAVRHGL
ncbi:hypothetical protein SUDANB58_00700 [Streptomyces sp. enrichment culture]|uniref:hypothetical protein n=1 Tax=Streptomyces sp. enrichment culture TaxID=1795815 RepID=UPI003F5524FF